MASFGSHGESPVSYHAIYLFIFFLHLTLPKPVLRSGSRFYLALLDGLYNLKADHFRIEYDYLDLESTRTIREWVTVDP